jgi:hypothetical protein
MKTSVEWLAKELESYGDPGYCKLEWETLDLLVQKAKEMEKQQIIDAFEQGEYTGRGFEDVTSEEYYHINFKSE